MNRVQPTEKQLSVAIFSIIDGLIFIIFFNRKYFEQAAPNIQIWVGVLHNIKIYNCYLLGQPQEITLRISLTQKFNTTILYKKETGRLPGRRSYIICELYFGVICRLIDISLQGKNYNCYIKSCTFYRPDKVFSRERSKKKLINCDQQANLNYLQGNVTQDSVYGNCLLKACR